MPRIIRKVPIIQVKIIKGSSCKSTMLAYTRQTPQGFKGSGRIEFNDIIYSVDINIDDTGDSIHGNATFTIIGSSKLSGYETRAVLLKVKNTELLVNAVWDNIPLPNTAAVAVVKLTGERNSRDTKFYDFEPTTLLKYNKKYRKNGLNSNKISKSTFVTIGSETLTVRTNKTACEGHGWPSCCTE